MWLAMSLRMDCRMPEQRIRRSAAQLSRVSADSTKGAALPGVSRQPSPRGAGRALPNDFRAMPIERARPSTYASLAFFERRNDATLIERNFARASPPMRTPVRVRSVSTTRYIGLRDRFAPAAKRTGWRSLRHHNLLTPPSTARRDR